MSSSGPTVVTFELSSAWIMILAVSSATLVATWALRKAISRPGGMSSGLLLLLPLVLPLASAVLYGSGVLPEISVLKPAGAALADGSGSLLRLLRVTDSDSGVSTFYSVTGSPGSWLIMFGLAVTSFMLVRRGIGIALVRRLITRCKPVEDRNVLARVESLSVRAGLKQPPETLLLPPDLCGAFATGIVRKRILLSQDLLRDCDEDELEGILAHEIAHLAAKDVQLTSLSGLLRDLVAWNPVAHVAHRKLCLDREYEADRRAADLTGDPLGVASGLLKAVETMRGRRGLMQRSVLAALGPGPLISRRVNVLLAVADGRQSSAPSGYLPFLLAGLMVASFGLEVGDRIASQDSGFAIVWGNPERGPADVWKAPEQSASKKLQAGTAKKGKVKRSKPKGKADLQRPIRLLGLSQVMRVAESDLELWMGLVDRRVKRAGLQAATARWEARRQYQAVPLFSTLPFGIYRIDREI